MLNRLTRMKNTPQLLDEIVPDSSLFDDKNLLLTKKKEIPEGFSAEVREKRWGSFNCLNNFWNRLISETLSFPHTPNSSISSMLDDEKELLVSHAVRSVLSNHLELPLDSKKLFKLTQECNKIFHEDYPFDFILEYQGKRLGMLLLDKCYNSENQEKLIYRFNPKLKSFDGLF